MFSIFESLRKRPATSPDPWRRKSGPAWWKVTIMLVVIAGVVIASIFGIVRIAGHGTSQGTRTVPLATLVPSPIDVCGQLDQSPPHDNGDGIGVAHSPDSRELIGISDGSFIFATNPTNPDRANLKCQGAQILKNQPDTAGVEWTQSLQILPSQVVDDSNDAEILIYREDEHVLETCIAPTCLYITFIVATTLTGVPEEVSTGSDVLQGAYETQEEFNRDPANTPPEPSASQPSTRMRLLIANFGSSAQQNITSDNEQQVIGQIGETVKTGDLHVKGVLMGLPSLSQSTIDTLTKIGIPIVLASGFSKTLIKQAAQPTLAKNIFYSIVPSIEREGQVGAKYVEQILQKKHIAVFYNPDDNQYSNILAQAFKDQLNGSNDSVWNETYSPGASTLDDSLKTDLGDAISRNADLIYFAGDATTADTLLQLEIQNNQKIQIMGGDELYHLGGYNNGRYKNLLFTSFAFPDEWDNLGQSGRQPALLNQYRLLFDGWPPDRSYGYSRPDSNVILAHDGLSVLRTACKTAACWASADNPKSDQLLNALVQVKDFEGFSGDISFGSDKNLPGNPFQKLVLVLGVDDSGHTHLEPENKPVFDGCLLKGDCPSI